eukprot:g1898.t1
MCCRKTASILAEILSSPSRLLLFCTLVLLLAFQEQFYFAEGSRNGRILKQSTESNQERPIASEINVTNAFSFRQALLQQNITTINIAGDLRLNTSVWENGTDNNPETGVKISRNLNIITLPSLDKQRIIYLDYMINRIVVDTDVTLTINGLVFKEVNKIAERSIGIPFIHYSNRSTVSIINSQFQFAIDSVGGNTLEASRSVLMSRRIPDGYEDWKPFVSVVSREQCEENRLRKVSCKDGALFVRQVASVVTPFNAMGHATGKAVFLIWNALLDAKDAHRFPELNPVSTNISSAIELRRAMQNKRIATIYIMRDIEITEDDFTDEERIPISRDITIQTSPEINRTCIIWLNFIEDAVEAGRSIKIRAYNLGFAGVSRRPEVQDRIPFFTFRDRASLILKNVTSEFAVDANERSSIRQLPFLWYGAAVQSETEDDGNIVRTVDDEWCLTDGRIECPIGALLITRGTRYFGVQEDRVVVGQYFIEFENVLVKAIDITKRNWN